MPNAKPDNGAWRRGQSKPGRPRTLSATFVKTINQPGRFGDGRGSDGLSLLVRETANGRWSKTWSQRIRVAGRVANIGLGRWPLVTLAEARAACQHNARLIAKGEDPRAPAATALPTFAEAAERVVSLYQPTWKGGGRTADIWRASLRDHATPALGARRVDQIQARHVIDVLTPLWSQKPETAKKLRQRIGTVMKWAVAQGYRADNPAGDAIDGALPKHNAAQTEHRKALPYAGVAAALATVEASGAWGGSKRCLRFLTLTAVRSIEARGARWDEVDLEAATWTIPATRMKSKRGHRVPLSAGALAVLRDALAESDGSELVFATLGGKVAGDATLGKLLRDLGIDGTVHGMRSSFRDWCGETGQPREIAEAALAHKVGGVEGSYFRSDLFERRRELMQKWGAYLTS